jgi:hypothetical protein
MEAPEVLFIDVLQIPILMSPIAWPIDPRFLLVCEPGSVIPLSVTTDTPALVGSSVSPEGRVVLDINPCGGPMPKVARVQLCGIRKGFAGMRFPDRDREQFLANEATLNSAYPAKDLD